MKFGRFPADQCEGAILAHSVAGDGWALKKGTVLSREDVALLQRQDVDGFYVARLEPGDVHEDAAAAEIAQRISGSGSSCSNAFTGRCNIQADSPGLVKIDEGFINRFNAIDESVTIATLNSFDPADRNQVIATVKIIPFSVTGAVMDDVRAVLKSASTAVSVLPFQELSVALINTRLPHLKASVVEKTTKLTERRVQSLGGRVDHVISVDHTFEGAECALKEALSKKVDLILVVGASVTVDRADAIPAAISAMGGEIRHFGMPVDPGNMVLVAQHKETPVVILPGCARSPKLNGIDWLLQRYAAGLQVARSDIMAMGVGGLLVDSPVRPLPRDQAVREPAGRNQPLKVAAIVLAAGQSRRMGPTNKLLQTVKSMPLVRHAVAAVVKSNVSACIVVTGYEKDDVEKALDGLEVQIVHNPNYEGGLSTTLKAGLAALPKECDAVVVCLADMPNISEQHINALIANFQPREGRAIIVPVFQGKRGNPVLWARQFWPSMGNISGDVGARHLIGQHEDLVYEVEFDDTAVMTDLDTPEQWSEFRRGVADS